MNRKNNLPPTYDPDYTAKLALQKVLQLEKVVEAREIKSWQVDTFADAQAFAPTLTSSAFIEVLQDETNSGERTLYYWNQVSLQEPLLL